MAKNKYIYTLTLGDDTYILGWIPENKLNSNYFIQEDDIEEAIKFKNKLRKMFKLEIDYKLRGI